MQSGIFDGSQRNYFFPGMNFSISHRAALRRPVRQHLDCCMYIRFVVAHIDEDSERKLGVFHAVCYLREQGELYAYEEEQHDSLRRWFNKNLERPTRFIAS